MQHQRSVLSVCVSSVTLLSLPLPPVPEGKAGSQDTLIKLLAESVVGVSWGWLIAGIATWRSVRYIAT